MDELIKTMKKYSHTKNKINDLKITASQGILTESGNNLLIELEELISISETVDKLKQELEVTEKLLNERQRVSDAIPECKAHRSCVPHAIEWIEEMKSKELSNKTDSIGVSIEQIFQIQKTINEIKNSTTSASEFLFSLLKDDTGIGKLANEELNKIRDELNKENYIKESERCLDEYKGNTALDTLQKIVEKSKEEMDKRGYKWVKYNGGDVITALLILYDGLVMPEFRVTKLDFGYIFIMDMSTGGDFSFKKGDYFVLSNGVFSVVEKDVFEKEILNEK